MPVMRLRTYKWAMRSSRTRQQGALSTRMAEGVFDALSLPIPRLGPLRKEKKAA